MSVIMRMGVSQSKANNPGAFMKMGATEKPVKEMVVEVTVSEEGEVNTEIKEDSELSKLHAQFLEKEGRPVPNNMKNNPQWILSKLNS